MFLHAGMEHWTSNPNSKIRIAYLHLCYTLGYPSFQSHLCPPPLSGSAKNTTPPPQMEYPNHSCMEHSKTPPQWPQLHLDQRSGKRHTWGNMELQTSAPTHMNFRCTQIETGFNRFGRLPLNQQHTNKGTGPNQDTPGIPTQSSPNLTKKVTNWKTWAYTDGSCKLHQGKQVTDQKCTTTPSHQLYTMLNLVA